VQPVTLVVECAAAAEGNAKLSAKHALISSAPDREKPSFPNMRNALPAREWIRRGDDRSTVRGTNTEDLRRASTQLSSTYRHRSYLARGARERVRRGPSGLAAEPSSAGRLGSSDAQINDIIDVVRRVGRNYLFPSRISPDVEASTQLNCPVPGSVPQAWIPAVTNAGPLWERHTAGSHGERDGVRQSIAVDRLA
jgi:hypothetical protein